MRASLKQPAAWLAPFLLTAPMWFGSCAKVVAPPGGPEDKEPPTLLTSVPYSHQTGVGPIREMVVVFSEALDSRNIEKSIFVTPRQTPPVKAKVKGERLIIQFPDTLYESQTYIVTISSNIADLRRNSLGESRIIAFTRGDVIDSNFISGIITSQDSPAEGVTVGLYRDFKPVAIGDLDSLYPDYLTVSGADGRFELSFLPPGNYFLLGFSDRDKNERFSYGVEDFAIPAELPEIGRRRQENLELRLRKVDTSTVSLVGVTTTADGLVRANFTKTVDPGIFAEHLQSIKLTSATDSLTSFPARDLIDSHAPPRKRLEFYIPTGKDGEYQLQIEFSDFYTDGRTAKNVVFGPYVRETPADSLPPRLLHAPLSRPTIVSEPVDWLLEFSEPIVYDSLNAQGFSVSYPDRAGLDFEVIRKSPTALEVKSLESPLEGVSQTLTVDAGSISDLSGNLFPDSTLAYAHDVWSPDSLGVLFFSIENRFDSLFQGEYLVDFKRLTTNDTQVFQLISKERDSLKFVGPAGNYVIEVTVDSETRMTPRKRDDGALYPLRLAERRAFFPDTVRIRPRFESSGVNIIVE